MTQNLNKNKDVFEIRFLPVIFQLEDKSDNEELVNNISEEITSDRWESLSRDILPERSYAHELAFSILLPMFIMIILASLLSLILCIDHDEL